MVEEKDSKARKRWILTNFTVEFAGEFSLANENNTDYTCFSGVYAKSNKMYIFGDS